MAASTVDVIMYGSTPMSTSRPMAPAASLVCSVVRTRWPVSAAWIATWAVSGSRISPTMIMSGSWRKMARSTTGKVAPILARTGIWVMPGR